MEWMWLVLLFLLGLAMLLKPEIFWKIEHIFSVKGGEPTEFYLALNRVCGVFLILGTIIFAVIALVL